MLKHEEPNDSKSKIELNPLLNQQTVTSSIKVEKSSTLKRFYERCKVPLFVIITLVILILCVILIVRTNGVVETNPSQNKYDIDLTQKSATGPPLLPGDNCAKKSRLCPADSYGGIFCGYPELGQVETITSGWQCSNYGVEMSCEKDIHGGNLMVGACNSGGGANCKEHCLGFNGLQCAKMEGVIIDWKSCQWISSGDGEFARCANGYVGTGMCASGLAANCNGKWNEIQCCKFDYSFQKVLIDSNYSVSAL
eukprot:459051_1